jgi:hypothetical protein
MPSKVSVIFISGRTTKEEANIKIPGRDRMSGMI